MLQIDISIQMHTAEIENMDMLTGQCRSAFTFIGVPVVVIGCPIDSAD